MGSQHVWPRVTVGINLLTVNVGVLSQHTSGCSDDFTDITIVSSVASYKTDDNAWKVVKNTRLVGFVYSLILVI